MSKRLLLGAEQAALDADGKPAWLRGLMGNDGDTDLLQEQPGASSEEEVLLYCPPSLRCRPYTPFFLLLRCEGAQELIPASAARCAGGCGRPAQQFSPSRSR